MYKGLNEQSIPKLNLEKTNGIDEFMEFINRSVKERPKHYISMFAKNTSSLNNLLNSSKGRDKFC